MKLDDLADDDDWCAWCGAALPHDGFYGIRKYCSPACRAAGKSAKRSTDRRRVRAGRTCQHCGEPIPAERNAKAIYCCKPCAVDAGNADQHRVKALLRHEARRGRRCEGCGGPIADSRPAGTRYCSRRCQRRRARTR